jgi:hypothetical protein
MALLTAWPVERPANRLARVNASLSAKEPERLRTCIARGQPHGGDDWVKRTAKDLKMEHTIRPEGRPPKRQVPGTGLINEMRPRSFLRPGPRLAQQLPETTQPICRARQVCS